MLSGVLITTVLPLCLAIVMFGMGISLVPNDFKRILVFPKAIAIGLIGQILCLPLIGYGFSHLFGLNGEHAVGLMVLAACAGGAVSNLIVYLARGDVALSITLTALSSIVTVFTIPFIVNFSLVHFMEVDSSATLDVLAMNIRLFMITVLPVLLGMACRYAFERQALRLEGAINKLASFLFVAIVAGILYQERANIGDMLLNLGPVSMCMNVVTMALGFFVARTFRLNANQSMAISIEIGVQNGATGIFIGATLLANAQIAAVPAAYSVVMLINAGILIFFARRFLPPLQTEQSENKPLSSF